MISEIWHLQKWRFRYRLVEVHQLAWHVEFSMGKFIKQYKSPYKHTPVSVTVSTSLGKSADVTAYGFQKYGVRNSDNAHKGKYLEFHDLKWQVESGIPVLYNKITSLLRSANHFYCISFFKNNFTPVICNEKDNSLSFSSRSIARQLSPSVLTNLQTFV